MSELEAFWKKFVDIKVAAEYYFLYSHRCRRTVWAINAVCLIVSGTSAAAWITNTIHPLAASGLILLSQAVSLLQPLFPFADRLYASRYLYREYTNLAAKAEKSIERVVLGRAEESSLAGSIDRIGSEMEAIEDKYATSDLFPRNNWIHAKAQKAAQQYLNVHFDLED